MKRITCPRCWRTSPNPHDVAQGYCGACHDWTAGQVVDDDATPLGRVQLQLSENRTVDLQVIDEGFDDDGLHRYAVRVPVQFTGDVLSGRASVTAAVLPARSSLHLLFTR